MANRSKGDYACTLIDTPEHASDKLIEKISEIENIAKAPPIAYADYYIFNNGTLEDYEKQLEEILKQI